jgi:hypothetical protein
MGATKKTARLAGLLYLSVVISGMFSLLYVRGQLAIQPTPAETVANLLAHDTLIRVNLVVGLVSVLLFLFVALTLYQLLKDVNRPMAAVMFILVLIQIPEASVSQLLEYGALELARGAEALSSIGQAQRESLSVLCLHMNDKGTLLAHFMWGFWLFPLGALIYRSGFIPRILGVWIIINGAAYIVQYATGLFAPRFSATLSLYTMPALLGEVALTFWLLIVGIKTRRPGPAATVAPA